MTSDWDVAFDVLCYLSARNRRRPLALDQVGARIGEGTSFDRFVFHQNLEQLGHLEIERDPATQAVTDWEVATTCLAGRDDEYFLCGWRSKAVLGALRELVADGGGHLRERPLHGAPTGQVVSGLDPTVVEQISGALAGATGVPVGVAHDAGRSLAERLPTLSEFIRRVPSTQVVKTRSALRWMPSHAEWRAVANTSEVGAYALEIAGMRSKIYVWRDDADLERGSMHVADGSLVAYVGALMVGEPLLGFDEASGTLYAPSRARLPGLFGRAACLAAGELPRPVRAVGGARRLRLEYRAVGRAVAERLAWLLTT